MTNSASPCNDDRLEVLLYGDERNAEFRDAAAVKLRFPLEELQEVALSEDGMYAAIVIRGQIFFTPLPGFDYFVEFRDSLVGLPDWQPLPGGPHNSGAVNDIPPPGVQQRFYRVRRAPQ